MAPLALIAALLLALAPTISRIAAGAVPGAQPILMELCTGAGTQLVDVSPFIATEEPQTMASMSGEACGYCALLPSLLPLSLASFAALVPRTSRSVALAPVTPVLPWPRNLRGLGSQAPPVLS